MANISYINWYHQTSSSGEGTDESAFQVVAVTYCVSRERGAASQCQSAAPGRFRLCRFLMPPKVLSVLGAQFRNWYYACASSAACSDPGHLRDLDKFEVRRPSRQP